ncbi:MAG: hypothetical protein Q9166_006983 [cf. Caloplaca sp. 2 TL-2023]
MACPLSAILNNEDRKPSITPNNAGVSRTAGRPQVPSIARTPITCEAKQTGPASLPYPAITFSPDKGSLYHRRVRERSDHAATALLSPPGSDPPSQETSSNNRGIFNRLLNHPELIFEMVNHLDVDHLLALYSISREFHDLANTRFTTMMFSQSLSKAAESAQIFPFRCYRSLCLRDPAKRRNEAKSDFQVRHVPGFQWLKMILFREQVVYGIVTCLEQESLMLPACATLTIKKIWFFMDLPTNKLRDGLIRNTNYWSEGDLYLAHLFIMKLDMLLTCPMTGEGDLGLRKMLLGQRSLSTLLRVLRREEMRNSYEMMKMIVAWNYERNDRQRALNQPIFGVPPHKIGMLQYEGWGLNPGVLFHQIDTVLTWECVRRGLDMPAHYLDMVFYGFVNKRTGLDIWTRGQKRKQEEKMERLAKGQEADKGTEEDEQELEESEKLVGEEEDVSDKGNDGDGPKDDEAEDEDTDETEVEAENAGLEWGGESEEEDKEDEEVPREEPDGDSNEEESADS